MERGDPEFYREIVDNARLAVGVPWVQLTSFDRSSGTIRQLAISGFSSPRMLRAERTFRRLTGGGRIEEVRPSVHDNRWLRVLYQEGQSIETTLREVSRGVVPGVAARLAELVGLRRTLGIPLAVHGLVKGALNFHSPHPFTARQRTIAAAFCRQVELTMENRELTRRLKTNLDTLTRLQRRLISTADEVKGELAAELHGRVQTRLLLAWRRLQHIAQTVNEETVRELIMGVANQLDEIREVDVRGISHRLVPPVLSTGLFPALSFLAALYEPDVRVTVVTQPAFDGAANIHLPVLPNEMRLAFYRVAEEALANAHRHGHAQNAELTLTFEPSRLSLRIWDDGLGFDPEAVLESLGFTVMRARMESLGGRLFIDSGVGRGTTITAELVPDDALKKALIPFLEAMEGSND